MQLWEELQSEISKLDQTLTQLKRYGKEFAQSQSNYYIGLRSEILRLRDNGESVTLASTLAKGTPKVAELRMKRDIAEALYKACQEGIMTYKLKIRIIENQLQREWTSVERN